MKNYLSGYYLAVILVLAGCKSANVLTYKNRQYYSENNILRNDAALLQQVCYNEPRVVDEEFCYELKLTFPDTSTAKTKKILDLFRDSSIVKSEYGVFSVWNWENKHTVVSGQIEIMKWSKDSVTLKENVVATDLQRKQTKKFKGTRTFTRKEGWSD